MHRSFCAPQRNALPECAETIIAVLMSISAGTRLGPYEIVALIGAGGMGEVYKARDTRLERSVAIKLLLEEFGDQSKFKLRFEREAKTISQLNHPNICTLYDIGQHDGASYIVMELIDGESLADHLAKGPLPLAEVFKYGAQIADALDRAHRLAIVHRDLKPGNIMLTRSGAKLLDFGLAKPQAAFISSREETQKPITQQGTIVGTLQYMSPEQLEGREADHRSDIFAFGAVIYEMATGKRAFIAKTSTSLIAAILKDEPPPMLELQPVTPSALAHVVTRCLAKDPEDRWQSAHDIGAELRWIAGDTSGPDKTKKIGNKRKWLSLILVPWLIASFAVVAITMGYWHSRHVRPVRLTKTIVSTDVENTWSTAPAISPDGRLVAYPASGALWIRSLDELEPRKLLLSASVVFWSPDSKWVAFISDDKLWKITPGGSAPVLIAPLPRVAAGGVTKSFHSGAWGANDRIVLSQFLGGLYETSARGGALAESLPADPNLVDFHTLSFLPDGESLLAVPHKLENRTSLEVIRDNKRKTILTFNEARILGVAYSPTGHLLVSLDGREQGVWAVPFSVARMQPTGKQFMVASGAGGCTASSDGSLLYVANINYDPKQIVRIDRTGKLIAKIGEMFDGASAPLLSPDERTLAVKAKDEDGHLSVWLVDLGTGARRRLTHGASADTPTSWSPDGRSLLIHRFQTSNLSDPGFGVWLVPLEGSDQPRKIIKGWAANFTPDGKDIVFLTFALRGDSSIASLSMRGGSPREIAKVLGNTSASALIDASVAISPDGHFIAYTSLESGTQEIYLTRYPSGEGKWPVSRGLGDRPVWDHDGRTLYFQSRNRLMSASFAESPAVVVTTPMMLFDTTPLNGSLESFQVLSDRSIIAIQNLPPDKRQAVLVQNWFAEFGEGK